MHALLVERAGRLVYEEYFNGQQRIYVLPDGRLVVTVLAGRYDDMTASGLPMRFLLEYIIPAVRGEGAKAGMLGG